MPNKVKKRWIARQIKRGNPRYVKVGTGVVEVEPIVEEFVEPIVEEVAEEVVEEDVEPVAEEVAEEVVEEVVEPTVVESGTVTDIEVIDEIKPAKKQKKLKK